MATIVTKDRPTTNRCSYTLPILKTMTSSQIEKELDYTIKLKRIPLLAELSVRDSDNGLLYKWTWYETEI